MRAAFRQWHNVIYLWRVRLISPSQLWRSGLPAQVASPPIPLQNLPFVKVLTWQAQPLCALGVVAASPTLVSTKLLLLTLIRTERPFLCPVQWHELNATYLALTDLARGVIAFFISLLRVSPSTLRSAIITAKPTA